MQEERKDRSKYRKHELFLYVQNKHRSIIFISIMNSRFAAFYVDNLVNSTSHCTTGDAKLIPIMIPTIEQLYECKHLFDKAFELKRSVAKGIATDLDIAEELDAVERANDLIVESIYKL